MMLKYLLVTFQKSTGFQLKTGLKNLNSAVNISPIEVLQTAKRGNVVK